MHIGNRDTCFVGMARAVFLVEKRVEHRIGVAHLEVDNGLGIHQSIVHSFPSVGFRECKGKRRFQHPAIIP